MNLEEKLREIRRVTQKSARELELERQLESLRRRDKRGVKLPAQRTPHGIEHYVEGRLVGNNWGEFFLARQALPFGRPYGKLRIGDLSGAEFGPLGLFLAGASLPDPSQVVFLDTETTGLAGGTGTCAFLIGLGAVEGFEFVVRQIFLRDYPDEKAALAALTEALEPYQALVTFNGKSFDVPLLETRYALARLKSPLGRLTHFDALHPARQLWKLRLERCELTHLEREILGISRKGDVEGSEIPGIYFDYLRTGEAQGLQPVFYHNALDIVTLATLSVVMSRAVSEAETDGATPSLDLFSLSRIFGRAGTRERSVTVCRRALEAGLPDAVEARALWHLAAQHKRQREHELAAPLWLELTRRESEFALRACEELAIHYEHRQRDVPRALEFAEAGLERLRRDSPALLVERFTHRLKRLQRKSRM